jgi:hypothetical protein
MHPIVLNLSQIYQDHGGARGWGGGDKTMDHARGKVEEEGKRIVVFSTPLQVGVASPHKYAHKIGLELSTMEKSMTKIEWERGATRAGWRRQEWKGWWVEEKRGKAVSKSEIYYALSVAHMLICATET